MQLKMHQYDTFRRHARMFIEPAIVHMWMVSQRDMLEQLAQQQGVILAGDFRTDSSGHSAKFGSYSVMDLRTNKIIDLQLVQSDEVGGSTQGNSCPCCVRTVQETCKDCPEQRL